MNPTAAKKPTLADRLRGVRIGLRDDLDVSRHVFRGEPCYIVRDPLTFQSHRFEPADYQILVAIDATRTLGQIFDDLVAAGELDAEDEERFYAFVFQLHRGGLLSLPVSDDKLLYRRLRARQDAKRRRRLLSLLFMQAPLWNPDVFLDRTMPMARFLFTRWFLCLWIIVIGAAGAIAASRWHEFVQPLNGVLASRNLPLIWITLIVLKVFHEFGHAYACKHFGGHVPEMGAYFIAGTPCAYVDATAAWSFPRRWQRMVVNFGGMYVEVFLAALATFVWAFTSPGLINSLAYNVIFLAGVTTILFNINPLMRYDGYYVFADLFEIPNLRSRAREYVLNVAKRRLLGVQAPKPDYTLGMRAVLFGYGVAATLYRTLVLVGIATLIATKVLFVGLLLAAAYIGSTLYGIGRRLFGYLWFAEETAPVRGRTIATSIVLIIAVPLGLGLIPVRVHVVAGGVLNTENETILRAETPGFVADTAVAPGQVVSAGDVLVKLENDDAYTALLQANTQLETAQLLREAFRYDKPDQVRAQQSQVESLLAERDRRRQQIDALVVTAPVSGRVIDTLEPQQVGEYIEVGQPLATIASGHWQVRVELTDEQLTACAPRVGDRVVFRPSGAPNKSITGRVERVRPAGTRKLDISPLTQFGGGDIVVSETGHAAQPYFEVTITLEPDGSVPLYDGTTGQVRFSAKHEPVGLYAYRSVVRFIDRISQS